MLILTLVLITGIVAYAYSKKLKPFQILEIKDQGVSKQISEDDLIGYWTPGFDADSMVFSNENGNYYYATYLDKKLFESGTWQLVDDKLNIRTSGNLDMVVFSSVKRVGDTLTVIDEYGNTTYHSFTSGL